MKLWQVARAATAAPMYFDEFKICLGEGNSRERIYFSDGGFGDTNNPTEVGMMEVEALYGRDCFSAIVSIGTARANDKGEGRGILRRVRHIAAVATDPRIVARSLETRRLENLWRFNDEIGLDIELDDWKPNGWTTKHPGHKTLRKIQDGFYRWAAQLENIDNIESCARHLVEIRRSRMADRSRWQRFSLAASQYQCEDVDCHETTYETLDLFNQHWNSFHREEPDADALRQPRYKKWEY